MFHTFGTKWHILAMYNSRFNVHFHPSCDCQHSNSSHVSSPHNLLYYFLFSDLDTGSDSHSERMQHTFSFLQHFSASANIHWPASGVLVLLMIHCITLPVHMYTSLQYVGTEWLTQTMHRSVSLCSAFHTSWEYQQTSHSLLCAAQAMLISRSDAQLHASQ